LLCAFLRQRFNKTKTSLSKNVLKLKGKKIKTWWFFKKGKKKKNPPTGKARRVKNFFLKKLFKT